MDSTTVQTISIIVVGIISFAGAAVTYSVNREVGEISTKNARIQKEISDINTEIAKKSQEISLINTEIANYDKEKSKVDFEISKMNSEVTNTQLEIEKTKLDYLRDEHNNKLKILKDLNSKSDGIASQISQRLIDEPTWLDNFMERTGATYGGSVFGNRIDHFYYEKQKIAKNGLKFLDGLLTTYPEKNFCFLIDSGTTLYHLFYELCKNIKNNDISSDFKNSDDSNEFKTRWSKRVCIVTNNLPGIQYLMKNCREDPNDEYSEILIPCFLLPGKPLSVYGAVTGDEACDWLETMSVDESEVDIATLNMGFTKNEANKLLISELEKYLCKLWKVRRCDYKIISLMSANYIVRSYDNGKESYYPVARGEGHTKIKRMFSEVSDQIFIFSPLMKFSFASVDELNKENGLYIAEDGHRDNIKWEPSKVKYNLIKIKDDHKKCTFFTTQRAQNNHFRPFGEELVSRLRQSYNKRVETVIFDIAESIPRGCANESFQELEFKKEIPHAILRDNYIQKKIEMGEDYIWDPGWIYKEENKN